MSFTAGEPVTLNDMLLNEILARVAPVLLTGISPAVAAAVLKSVVPSEYVAVHVVAIGMPVSTVPVAGPVALAALSTIAGLGTVYPTPKTPCDITIVPVLLSVGITATCAPAASRRGSAAIRVLIDMSLAN